MLHIRWLRPRDFDVRTTHKAIYKGSEYVTPITYEPMKHYPCSVERRSAATVMSGNVRGRFHECWHQRFNLYSVNLLQVH
jgi:hypothetical protein